MAQQVKLIVYPVQDIATAKELYRTFLGTDPYVDQPYYVGFRIGDQEIGLDPGAHTKGITSPVCYVETGDIKGGLQNLLSSGGTLLQSVHDVGGGKLIATVKDAEGNVLGLMQQP